MFELGNNFFSVRLSVDHMLSGYHHRAPTTNFWKQLAANGISCVIYACNHLWFIFVFFSLLFFSFSFFISVSPICWLFFHSLALIVHLRFSLDTLQFSCTNARNWTGREVALSKRGCLWSRRSLSVSDEIC